MATARERAQRLVLRIAAALRRGSSRDLTLARIAALSAEHVDLRLIGDTRGALRFVQRHPRLFALWKTKHVDLMDEAEQLVQDRCRRRLEAHEAYIVYVLRKLLMLSGQEVICARSLEAVRRCFGFPWERELMESIFYKYPHYFHLDRRAFRGFGGLKLMKWDPELAITSRDKTLRKLLQCGGDYSSVGIPVEDQNGVLSPGYEELLSMHSYPLPSPYANKARHCNSSCCSSLLHEVLSLTLSKRASLRGLSELRQELELGDKHWMVGFFARDTRHFVLKSVRNAQVAVLRDSIDWNHVPELTPYLQARKQLLQLMDQDCCMDDLFQVPSADHKRAAICSSSS